MRALLYLNLDDAFQANDLLDSAGPVAQAERFASALDAQKAQPTERTFNISWGGDAGSAEMFHALPLEGRGKELLGGRGVGGSEAELAAVEKGIALLAAVVAGGGLLIGLLISWWAAARVTRPVTKLAEGAQKVSQGDLAARVDVKGSGEVADLAK